MGVASSITFPIPEELDSEEDGVDEEGKEYLKALAKKVPSQMPSGKLLGTDGWLLREGHTYNCNQHIQLLSLLVCCLYDCL